MPIMLSTPPQTVCTIAILHPIFVKALSVTVDNAIICTCIVIFSIQKEWSVPIHNVQAFS